jgi:hypothetical protein
MQSNTKQTSADTRRIAHAESMASMWLNRGNEANTKAARERAYEKSQNWLDKVNVLRGLA